MPYLTCSMIPSVELARYGVSRAKIWVSGDCAIYNDKNLPVVRTHLEHTITFKPLNILSDYDGHVLTPTIKYNYYK